MFAHAVSKLVKLKELYKVIAIIKDHNYLKREAAKPAPFLFFTL
jgi:hypothetical protein